MATKKFDAGDFEFFLRLLPKSHGGVALRHAVEVRHESFACEEFIALCRMQDVAIIFAADSELPLIPDLTADFVYARLMGTKEKEKLGYPRAVIQKWAARAKDWAAGASPEKLGLLASPAPKKKRDVYVFFISGAKARNPAAAMALIQSL